MKKRLAALLLAICSLLTLLPAAAVTAIAAGSDPFEDVGLTDWYYEAVTYAYENELFSGTSATTFDPRGSMTRGMYATVLGRMAEIDVMLYDYSDPDFRDVKQVDYFAPYVAWAAEYGITEGVGEGLFGPGQLVTREQMAAFTVRFLDAYAIEYPAHVTDSLPKDLATVSDWAKEPILKLWACGLLQGDDKGNVNPKANATRAEAATFFMRVNEHLFDVGFKTREDVSVLRVVSFWDGDRLIERIPNMLGHAMQRVPVNERRSKAGAVFEGWYLDPELTMPFYAENPILCDMNVYAKYTELEVVEDLTVDSFVQENLTTDASILVKAVAAAELAPSHLKLTPQDGTVAPTLEIVHLGDGSYAVSAKGGFPEGGAYELVLDPGFNFISDGVELPGTVRTLSFWIQRPIETDLKINHGNITYIQDTAAMSYTGVDSNGDGQVNGSDEAVPILFGNMAISEAGGHVTVANAGGLKKDSILCFYFRENPVNRDYVNNAYTNDPAVYVKVEAVSGNDITFVAMGQEDMGSLYVIPDVFPMLVNGTETEGVISLDNVDFEAYALIVEADIVTLAYGDKSIDHYLDPENNLKPEDYLNAKLPSGLTVREDLESKLNPGDFIAMYQSIADVKAGNVTYGKVTGYDEDQISYTLCTKEDVIDAGDVHVQPVISGEDFLTAQEADAIAQTVQAQIAESGFAEDAAYMLAEMAMETDSFRNMDNLRLILLSEDSVVPLSAGELQALGGVEAFQMSGQPQITAQVIRDGSQLHFNGGLRLSVAIRASFEVDTADGSVVIDLDASFIEELAIKPQVSGKLTYTEILGCIPVPNGVHLAASIDVKNYTAYEFHVEATTKAAGSWVESTIEITDELLNLSASNGQAAPDADVEIKSGTELIEKYCEMLQKQTDWVELVNKQLAEVSAGIYAVNLMMKVDVVIRANMSIALGSTMEYEVGKRYTFWFEVGLYTPRGGSETMDLLDESLVFQFYVMGKLEMKVGARVTLGVSIGSASFAYAGIYAELGPYVKLYGFFIYNYERWRAANATAVASKTDMMGGLLVETGIYLMVGVEASALADAFSASYDFCNEEFPILEAGATEYPFKFTTELKEGERIYVYDSDGDSSNGVTMVLPDSLRAVSYVILKSGLVGSRSYDYDAYNISLSNPNFSFHVDEEGRGIVTADVPEKSRIMSCDITFTYRHSKMAFSTNDITVTLPLTWTNLSASEREEFYTASVRVGNNEDGYTTVWSGRYLKTEAFELPTEEEIRTLAGFNPLTYEVEGSGYAEDYDTSGGIVQDTVYDFIAVPKTYELTVTEVQNPDNRDTRTMTFFARYGQAFDFRALNNTGRDLDGEEYTRFNQVVTDAKVNVGTAAYPRLESIDLTQPISGRYAEALSKGEVTARAEYLDETVEATFRVTGVDYNIWHQNENDVDIGFAPKAQKIRRGENIDMSEILAQNNVHGKVLYGVLPNPNLPMMASTEYTLQMGDVFEGTMNTIHFEQNLAYDDDVLKVETPDVTTYVGSWVVPLKKPQRTGYKFEYWCSDPGLEHQIGDLMPEGEPVTYYAKWTPLNYVIRFDVNSSVTPITETITVTYDQPYPESLWNIRPDARTEHGFIAWYYQKEHETDKGIVRPGVTNVDRDTIYGFVAYPHAVHPDYNDHVLYAHWRDLKVIGKDVITFQENEKPVYKHNTTHAYTDYGTITFHSSEVPEPTEDYLGLNPQVKKGDFSFRYKVEQGADREWAETLYYAGSYMAEASRPADDFYKYFVSWPTGVMEVQKATRTITGMTFKADDDLAGGRGFTTLKVEKNGDIFDLDPGKKQITTNASQPYVSYLYTCVETGQTSATGFFDGLEPGKSYNFTVKVIGDRNYHDATSNSASVTTASAPTGSWADHRDENWSGGIITTAGQLAQYAYLMNEKGFGGDVTLGADIDLSAYQWTPIQNIKMPLVNDDRGGNFDGAGYTISGLYATGGSNVGLFSSIFGVTVQNLVVDDAYVSGTEKVAPIAGSASGGSIVNCVTYGYVACGSQQGGGIAGGANSVTINGCVSHCTVKYSGSGNGYAGGIVGYAGESANVVNCINYGNVSGFALVGGIAGQVNAEGEEDGGKVLNSANFGKVTGSVRIGGIAGQAREEGTAIYNCVNYGKVTGSGTDHIGAIAGTNEFDNGNDKASVHQCYYPAGIATAAGSSRGAVGVHGGSHGDQDGEKNVNCSSFGSDYQTASTCETGATSNLADALNTWVNRCNKGDKPCTYLTWTSSGDPKISNSSLPASGMAARVAVQ